MNTKNSIQKPKEERMLTENVVSVGELFGASAEFVFSLADCFFLLSLEVGTSFLIVVVVVVA
jgi:hypothetical protein